nr:uncharacterized protein LOC101885645 [Danio rerio]|eukprot:XP_021322747.1 uncharacterized protein LOC101885645 [Danio rerio]
MAHSKDPVGHWKDLETWLSVVTGSLLPKAAETLQPLTQNQLDENINSIMKQDPSQSFNHKELAKITGTLSHTLIATLKLSDRHASQLQHKLTRLQARIEQLELEAQERLEQPNEVDEGTTEEINKLQEALTAITEQREQARADHADVANKLDYAEQLLKEAKVDLRDKKARIKALETHLSEARHEIDRLMQEVDDIKEESASELRHAYALRWLHLCRNKPDPAHLKSDSTLMGVNRGYQVLEGCWHQRKGVPVFNGYVIKPSIINARMHRAVFFTKKTLLRPEMGRNG